MEAELAALAASGATTVVGLMATDGWNAVRSRVAAMLRRGSTGEDVPDRIAGELDLERREVTAARDGGDTATLADLEAVWRTRLRRLLTEDPAAGAALRSLIDEYAGAPRPGVHNVITGGDFDGVTIQAGSINGDVRRS